MQASSGFIEANCEGGRDNITPIVAGVEEA